jgi:hypothetical protein
VRESRAAMAVEPAIHGVDPALRVSAEDQAEVVRSHADSLRERQTMHSRELSQISNVADAPFGFRVLKLSSKTALLGAV